MPISWYERMAGTRADGSGGYTKRCRAFGIIGVTASFTRAGRHLLFDLRHLRRDLAGAGNSTYADHFIVEVPDDRLFAFHKLAWDRLEAEFATHVDGTVRADRRMRSWTQPRRSPWGIRSVEVDMPHPWGLPAGTEVLQVVLAEKFRSRARGSTGWLHHPIEMLAADAPEERNPTNRGNAERRGNLDPTVGRICERLIGGPWPRFAYHEVIGGVNRIRFYNHPNDTSPDSYMAGARDRIDLVGTHDLGSGLVLSASADRIVETAEIAVGRRVGDDHLIVEEWRAIARGRDNIRSALGRSVPQAVAAAFRVWIRSVEGAGKTTALLNPSAMDLIHTLPVAPVEGLDGIEPWPVRVMVACGSYMQAQEKLETFDRLCAEAGAPYRGFLFRSVTRLYRDCLDGEDEIDLTEAFKLGDGSIWRLVRTRQKAVWKRMLEARRKLHVMMAEGSIPVLFTVLDVAEGHADRRITRLFYAPSFDEGWYAADIETRSALRLIYEAETPIETLIVDEVSVRSLLNLHAHEKVKLAETATAYIEKHSDLRRPTMYRAFQAWKEMKGGAEMTFIEWEQISALGYRDEHRITVDVSTETPFDGSGHIYAAMHGRGVYIQPKTWWRGFPRVVFLTTEILPTIVAKAVADGLVVFDFDSEVENNEVMLRLDRAANKEGLASLTARILADAPDAAIISNMVEGATTHVSARGANGLADADIFGLYTAISPQQFCDLAALNVRFGLTDAVRLHYVDQFNQTAGRNRGMRDQGRMHTAVFSPRLYRWLAAHLAAFGRYRLKSDDVQSVELEEAVVACTV